VTDDLRPWTILMLSAGALFTGGLVWYAWERVWIWRRLDIRAFAVDFRRSVRKADPAMPILLVICGTAAGVFASIAGDGSRTLALVAIGLLVVILLGSIFVAEPINSQFRRRSEGEVPPEADQLRRRWRRLHLARTCLGLAALVCLITAVAYALPSQGAT
jgi:drug/metabolite transporter (DMT)-like permease